MTRRAPFRESDIRRAFRAGAGRVEIVTPDGVTYRMDAATYQPETGNAWDALAQPHHGRTSRLTATGTGAPAGAGARKAPGK